VFLTDPYLIICCVISVFAIEPANYKMFCAASTKNEFLEEKALQGKIYSYLTQKKATFA